MSAKAKQCGSCDQVLSLSSFYQRADSPGYRSSCISCWVKKGQEWSINNLRKKRGYHLKRKYGISLDEKEAMKIAQSNQCAICLREAELHIDHNHETGAIRGMLCPMCNSALGLFRDDVNVMKAAIKYLEDNA